ncbi:hypothetical protein DY000_02014438 [Brassica cretica]|uniref:Uncharacterized protein n=1 Tax=Brassica cretica TaxID=69181 RepID=A0ABQ7D038_BRACR|nr:hypothetical protein DY000_02014438 [Brassica cretica]
MEIAGHMDVYASGALYKDCGYAYIVVVLCTESVVCGLASHTSLGDSPVAHPSFFPLQESFHFRKLISGEAELKSLILVLQLTSVDRIFRCSFQHVAKRRIVWRLRGIWTSMLAAHCMEIAGCKDVCASGALVIAGYKDGLLYKRRIELYIYIRMRRLRGELAE